MSATLVVLAAGMGSRYGGLKQIDPVGLKGEKIIDYSVYDAIRAGFDKVVFVIRREIESDFRATIGDQLARQIEVSYAYQEIDQLPEGFSLPVGRTKPWGTGHATLAAADQVSGPFAVINADDFYGQSAYQMLYDYLQSPKKEGLEEYAMVGYVLNNTLSEFGYVSRGVCGCDGNGYLENIVERTQIEKIEGQVTCTIDDGSTLALTGQETVSMNFWGFSASIFGHLREQFATFLTEQGENLKAEFYLPATVDQLIKQKVARTKVLQSHDSWFGITYQEDREPVQTAVRKLIAQGEYPASLF